MEEERVVIKDSKGKGSGVIIKDGKRAFAVETEPSWRVQGGLRAIGKERGLKNCKRVGPGIEQCDNE